eukprot:SAG22_NODE_38_length_26325_cov_107.302067_38_plen_95_part_00
MLSFKGSDHCLSALCFSAFPCGSTVLTADTCCNQVIDKAREVYRPVAARGSLHFFLVDKLNALAHMYQYSMANYVDILNKGIDLTPAHEDLSLR